MTAPPPDKEDRFRSAAAHYRAGRVPYPPALIARIAELTGLKPQHRLLDLGCGPGLLAMAFAPRVAEVVAMDPSGPMLEVARGAAAGISNVHFLQAGSSDLGQVAGPFRLVTMGRSFHWMDRQATLAALDGLIAPGGAIALLSDSWPDLPVNDWRRSWSDIRQRYGHKDILPQHGPGWVRHEAVLLASPFRRLERIGVLQHRAVDAATLVTRALSMSDTSEALLGPQAAAMAAEMRSAMADVREEVAESVALLAWRG